MSTASFELAQSIPTRIRELRILIKNACENESKQEDLYNAICRSTCVLMASHLEGFLKDLFGSLISDLNYNLKEFSRMPSALQRSFCEKITFYEGVPPSDIETRIRQLTKFFVNNTVKIDMSAFTYKETRNKNPSSTVIDSTMEKLGVPNVLHSIAIPAFEIVFNGNDKENYTLNRNIRRNISILYSFPFKSIPSPYSPVWRIKKELKSQQTLWHAFVEDVMSRRHNIVHGNTMSNDTSWEELYRDSEKLRILMYGILFSAASYLSSVK